MEINLHISYNLGINYNYKRSDTIVKVIDYPLNKGLNDKGYYIDVYSYNVCRETIMDILKLDNIKYTTIRIMANKLLINNKSTSILKYVTVYISNIDYYRTWNRKTIIEELI